MGSLRGDLEVLGIANLMQALTAGPRVGRLTVSREADSKTLQCGPRGLRLLKGNPRVSPLGQILLRTRKLTRAQLTEVLADHKKSGLPLGEYVTKRGLLAREDIDKALQEQAADEIYDLFMWTQGTFEFVETEEEPERAGDGILSSVIVDQSVMFIALEAARRMDHLAQIREVIPGERLVPIALEIPTKAGEPGLDRDSLREILPFVDGKRSVEEIIEESLYPRFTVLMALHAMAQRGSAKIRDMGAQDGPETVLLRKFTAAPRAAAPDGATVVLMSDNNPSRLAVSLYLGNLGFTVLECPTNENLPRLLSRTSAGAVLLETNLGAADGLDLSRRLSKAGLPLLVMTPLTEASVANAFMSNARHVLVKPVNSELMLERLRESLLSQTTATS